MRTFPEIITVDPLSFFISLRKDEDFISFQCGGKELAGVYSGYVMRNGTLKFDVFFEVNGRQLQSFSAKDVKNLRKIPLNES
jgi:hypothetical protein